MAAEDLANLVAKGFAPVPADAHWQQFDVALLRVSGDALPSARAMFGALAPLVDRWLTEETLHGWFFMRKPPDVRLRFCLRSQIATAAAETLEALVHEQMIESHLRGLYQPEVQRFGGPAAMALAHACFHVDSRLWLHLDALDERGLRKVDTDLLMPSVIHHLFRCCCGSGGAMEAWQALAALIVEGTGPIAPRSPSPPIGLEVLMARDGLEPSERLVLQTYAQANERFGRELAGLRSGASIVRQPVARIAASVALFHLNRHGVRGERSGPMAAGVLAALGG